MNEKEIKNLKKELMKPGWTEDLHYELKELNPADSRKIVESMTDSEIYQKVNIRRFQQDYIADYLEYLWDISESSFWQHVKSTLDVDEGLLWSDNMFHFDRLCSEQIPNDVLVAVIDFVIGCDENEKQDLEIIGCVIKAQVENYQRLSEIKKCIETIAPDKKNKAYERIENMINSDCNYTFY